MKQDYQHVREARRWQRNSNTAKNNTVKPRTLNVLGKTNIFAIGIKPFPNRVESRVSYADTSSMFELLQLRHMEFDNKNMTFIRKKHRRAKYHIVSIYFMIVEHVIGQCGHLDKSNPQNLGQSLNSTCPCDWSGWSSQPITSSKSGLIAVQHLPKLNNK